MKQIIHRNKNNDIFCKYYKNNKNQYHGLYMDFHYNGNQSRKFNYINGKLYGLNTWYWSNNKIEKDKYFL